MNVEKDRRPFTVPFEDMVTKAESTLGGSTVQSTTTEGQRYSEWANYPIAMFGNSTIGKTWEPDMKYFAPVLPLENVQTNSIDPGLDKSIKKEALALSRRLRRRSRRSKRRSRRSRRRRRR